MLEINSRDNEKIKVLRKLHQKKYRDKLLLFFIENFVLIRDAAKAGYFFEEIYFTDKFYHKNKDFFDNLPKNQNIKLVLISENINKYATSLDTPSGVFAVYKKELKTKKLGGKIIYLNAISDPGNLGSIFRSALAFGFKDVVIDENCADVYNPKTIHSAKDSIFKLNLVFDKKLDILRILKNEMKIYSTRLESGKDLNILKDKQSFCLVFGSEAHGVDEDILSLSDDFIKIRMSNEIESLNVSVSAGIIFYELYKE